MAATAASPELHAEQKTPEVAAQNDQQSKSYVDALKDDPPQTNDEPSSGQHDLDVLDGGKEAKSSETTKNVGKEQAIPAVNGEQKDDGNPDGNGVSSGLKDVTNGSKAPGDSDISKKKDARPVNERKESLHEYEAAGLDESPRTPPRYRHRKTASKGSVDIKNSTAKLNDEDGVFETFQDKSNGGKLTSVKSANGIHAQALAQSRKEQSRHKVKDDDKSLVSGRQAGQRWKQTPIRWAPLNVPLQRRLQTLVVLFHSVCIALSVSIFFFLCAIPLFWPLAIPYLIWVMSSNAGTSGTLRHRSNFLRGLPIWSLFASYFPARLHRTAELPPTRKYIFGYHPHGIISHGAFAAFCTEAMGFSQLFPGITNTLLTLDSNFRIPIYRDYALAMGLASVSRESCENLLSKGGPNKEGMGRAITIVVGGARESLGAEPYSLRLVLKRRKGFVKMALRTGADLVPVLAFGENDLYDQFLPHSHPKIHKIQLLVKKLLGFTIPLFHARGVFNYDVGLMPYRRPLNIVVGRPIKVQQSSKPSQEEIDTLHETYIVELERIWETWKDDFAKDRKEDLRILE